MTGRWGCRCLTCLSAGKGREWSGLRYSESTVGNRMVYVGHETAEEFPWSVLTVSLRDPITGLALPLHIDASLTRGCFAAP